MPQAARLCEITRRTLSLCFACYGAAERIAANGEVSRREEAAQRARRAYPCPLAEAKLRRRKMCPGWTITAAALDAANHKVTDTHRGTACGCPADHFGSAWDY